MLLKFDFVPHNINNIFQNIKHINAFSKHLLITTNNQILWHKLISIDPYSLCINKNDSINIVINILQLLKHLVLLYIKQYNLKENEFEEIKSYDILLDYLHDRLKNGITITHKAKNSF